ncbi:hypothetical protein QR680_005884 [Steinernema hermaphroditum]|uniref:Epoxide hydrolase n=1 Tax=Steinernema hermaphroditum TaxID=289476 RepID=A0AA39HTP3_9BILA|nr:hypothetical protein QR680_005884 [Steinernema hermaphroditum]
MGTFAKLVIAVAVVIVAVNLHFYFKNVTHKLDIPKDGYFGPGAKHADNTAIKPFKVNVPDAVLQDLKRRLEQSRLGHEVLEDVDSFEYGFNSKYLLEVKEHWLKKYDWRKYEAILNSFPQYTTEIEGLNIHFLRVQPPKTYKKVYPLLIVHGWPGNVFEFYKIIPMLTDPNKNLPGAQQDFAFEVIAPSIPGYGWSDAARKTGLNQISVARIFKKLMERLGKPKFFTQGGDWGSAITTNLAKLFPENVIGVHLNVIFVMPHSNAKTFGLHLLGHLFPSFTFSSPTQHQFSMKTLFLETMRESGYFHIQATKPDTVGVALNDSPLGLAAYILEKFSTWTNLQFRHLPDGGITKKFTLDEVLTIVMIYWTNGNIAASQRFYKEFFMDPNIDHLGMQYLSAPTGYACFRNDVPNTIPEEIVAANANLTHFKEYPDGGHFAAFELPKLLAGDVFTFVGKVEKMYNGRI